MMEIIIIIANVLKWLIFIYMSLATFYVLFFSIAGLFKYNISIQPSKHERKIAVLIPGYKEDDVIVNVAQSALKQDYSPEKYDVIVIADSFSENTLNKLKKLPIKVIEVAFDISSKSKSLNKAMQILPSNEYEIAVILDADNLMEKCFLKKINTAFENGSIAIQGHRTAKNFNTPIALLDSISEEINNHIFRKGHRVIGFSSALIGSGMAFNYDLFKESMSTINSFGEDKELEINLIERHIRIEYLEDAYVFDEKIEKSKSFVRQRTRWISNQILYAKKYFFRSFYHLFVKLNMDYFEKVMQHFQPPRIFLGGTLFLAVLLAFVFNDHVLRFAWLIIFMLFIVSMFCAIPKKFINFKTLRIFYLIPLGYVLMLFSLINARQPIKSFNPTKHSGNIGVDTNDIDSKNT